MPRSKAKRTRTFDAVLERTGDRLNWTVIRVPFDVHKVWGRRGQLRVKGEVNGCAFRTSLFPDGKGGHGMIVNRKMQAGGRARLGSKARFRMEPDTESRQVEPPQELVSVLRQSRQLQKFFERLSDSMRNDIARWITEGKHSETRARRAGQIAERLMQTMEAERELPPVLQVALARNPRARAGWELMTPVQRRSQLFGIFYYRDPESRARRVHKAIEAMLERADRSGKN